MSKISLGHENTKKIFFKLALPSVLGSIQMMVDGFFIANTVGANGLAAINLSMPVINLYMSIAMMICAGGAVYTSIELGKGNKKRANEVFSFTFFVYIAILRTLSILGAIFIDKIIYFLGASKELIPLVKPYLITLLVLNLLFNFPIFSEMFVKIGGLPNFVFISALICISGNILGDYILIVQMNLGVFGATLATGVANGTAGVILFTRFLKNRCALTFTSPKGNKYLLGKIFTKQKISTFTPASGTLRARKE